MLNFGRVIIYSNDSQRLCFGFFLLFKMPSRCIFGVMKAKSSTFPSQHKSSENVVIDPHQLAVSDINQPNPPKNPPQPTQPNQAKLSIRTTWCSSFPPTFPGKLTQIHSEPHHWDNGVQPWMSAKFFSPTLGRPAECARKLDQTSKILKKKSTILTIP